MAPFLQDKHYKKALTKKFAFRNKPSRFENERDIYQRSRLRDASNSVRLLYVCPNSCSIESNGTHLIRCELLTHSVGRLPQFVALSYTWGNPSTTHKIVIGRQIIEITETLANALQQMQHPKRTLKVWADALCINQADDIEKGQQVQMMDKIYTKACLVYASLGAGDDDSSKAIRKIRFFNRVYDRMREKEKLNKGAVIERVLNTSLERMRHRYSIEPITSFLNRPWFSRIWVFQEVALSKRLICGCGTESLTRNELFIGTILWHSAGIRLGWPHMPLKTLRIGCYAKLPIILKDFARSLGVAEFSVADGYLY
ncbi:heterokaryon incompatibility protein-domain-containing protein [Pestalotiopsis sp. NC0098]|nr:heterokaryon incompatibility protein-domain-containing protein [Pestalotiopsis sp. NC0098]